MSTERVVIVTGSRNWTDEKTIHNALADERPTLVVQGGARGADKIALRWAVANSILFRTFEADWRSYGKRAGHMRNREMLLAYPNALVLAFPLGGPGTADCMYKAEVYGMRLKIFSESSR